MKVGYLKLKSEVGMAVLKSKQTRLVGIISTYVVHTYTYNCFSRQKVHVYGTILLLFSDIAIKACIET